MLIWITVAATVAAIVSTTLAWRAVVQERRRSAARVAALSREIYAPAGFDLELSPPDPGPAAPGIGILPETPPRARFGLAVAVLAFVAASTGAAVIVFDGASDPVGPVANAAEERRGGETATGTLPADTAVELVALAHERQGDRLIVRGRIRNPASGVELDRLVAVISLFDRNGNLVASGRSALESSALIPGGESSFTVSVPANDEVARYRVSFRSGERVVSHIDKRSGQ